MNDIQILTSQNVTVNFGLGNVGHRMIAFLIDCFIKGIYNAFVISSFSYFFVTINFQNPILYFILSIPVLCYTLVCEIFMNGQTFGKKLIGIRVIKIDGFAAGSKEFFLRWLTNDVWLVLSLTSVFYAFTNNYYLVFLAIPLIFIIDFIVLTNSKKGQRIGDMLAGTTTILVKNRTHINQTILENLADDYKPTYAQVVKLSDGDARIIKDAFNTARSINDTQTISRLRQRVEEVIGVRDESKTDLQFIHIVMNDFNYYTQDMR